MIHLPFTAKGNQIIDAKGEIIAHTISSAIAQALVTIINGAGQ